MTGQDTFSPRLYPDIVTDLLTTSAGAAGVDPALVAAVIQQESTFDPSAVSESFRSLLRNPFLIHLRTPAGR